MAEYEKIRHLPPEEDKRMREAIRTYFTKWYKDRDDILDSLWELKYYSETYDRDLMQLSSYDEASREVLEFIEDMLGLAPEDDEEDYDEDNDDW